MPNRQRKSQQSYYRLGHGTNKEISIFTDNALVIQRRQGKRLCKKIAKHVIWTRRMLWSW